MTGDFFKYVGLARQRDRLPRWRGYGDMALGMAYLSLMAVLYIAPGAVLGLLYGDWQAYEPITAIYHLTPIVSLCLLCALVVAGVILALTWRKRRHSSTLPPYGDWRIARALGAALAAPDDASLPPEATQPEPLTESTLRSTSGRLTLPTELTLAPQFLNPWLMLVIGLTLLNILAQAVIFDGLRAILSSTAAGAQRASVDAYISHASGVWFAGNMVLLVLLLVVILSSIRPNLRANTAGMTWRRLGRRITLSWDSVTAIGAYHYSPHGALAGVTTYLLASEVGVITWQDDPVQPRRSAAARRLLRLAATRTGIPVRDMQPLVRALVVETARQRPPAEALAPIADLLPRAATLLAVPSVILGIARQRRIMRLLGALCAFLVCGPLLAALTIQTIGQPSYFATLPAKIHAQAPIFTDSLRAPDGVWPIQRPSQDDYRGFAYTPQGYTLTSFASFNQPILTLIPGQYSAVALQVTVVENIRPTAGDRDGAGLILRGAPSSGDQDGSSFLNDCSFMIDPTGAWMFNDGSHDFLNTDPAGHNVAIHTGVGAANTLLVIARGNQYIGYVNGQYVGQYYDAYNICGARGSVGVASRNGTSQVTFTDFAVWPVNPPPALNYV